MVLQGAEAAGMAIRTEMLAQNPADGWQVLQKHGLDSRDDFLGPEEHGIKDVEPPAEQVEDAPQQGMIERPGNDRTHDGAQPDSASGT